MLTIWSIYKSKLCQASSEQLSKWPHNVQQGEKTGLGSGWGGGGTQFSKYLPFGFLSRTIFLPKCRGKSKYLFRIQLTTKKINDEVHALYTWRKFGDMVVSEKHGYNLKHKYTNVHLFCFACLDISFEDLGQWEDWRLAPGAQDRGINHPFENPWNLTLAQD